MRLLLLCTASAQVPVEVTPILGYVAIILAPIPLVLAEVLHVGAPILSILAQIADVATAVFEIVAKVGSPLLEALARGLDGGGVARLVGVA